MLLTGRYFFAKNRFPLSGNNSVVECDLAKVEVAGSNPVSRSKKFERAGSKSWLFFIATPSRSAINKASSSITHFSPPRRQRIVVWIKPDFVTQIFSYQNCGFSVFGGRCFFHRTRTGNPEGIHLIRERAGLQGRQNTGR